MPKKVAVIGPTESGKTALMKRLIENGFSNTYEATIGCTFYSRNKIQFWDTSGKENRCVYSHN